MKSQKCNYRIQFKVHDFISKKVSFIDRNGIGCHCKMNPTKSKRDCNQKSRSTSHCYHKMRHPSVLTSRINKFLKNNIRYSLFCGKPKMRKHFSSYQIRNTSFEIDPCGWSLPPNRITIDYSEESKHCSKSIGYQCRIKILEIS